jgi:hypothetical protein
MLSNEQKHNYKSILRKGQKGMKFLNTIKKLTKRQEGEIAGVIAAVISIVLVLGLIAYAIMGQVTSVKDAGDNGKVKQDKLGVLMNDSDVVTGTTVQHF